MPVPSSYNDITNNKTIRDFVGWAWYDRGFYPDSSWNSRRVVLRIDSAHYYAIAVSMAVSKWAYDVYTTSMQRHDVTLC